MDAVYKLLIFPGT